MFIREKDALFIIKECKLNNEFVSEFEKFHNNFPNVVCYIEDDDGHIIGIFSLREYKKTAYMGHICINTEFTYISPESEVDIENFHTNNPSFVNIPIISNGVIEREYCFSESEWVSDLFEWNMISDDTLSKVIRHYKDDASSIFVFGSEISNRCSSLLCKSESEANFVVMDMPDYYNYLRKKYYEGEFATRRVLSEYNLYVECVIVQMMEVFRDNNIRVKYVGAPNASKMSHLSDRDKGLLIHPQTVSEMKKQGQIEELYSEFPESLAFMEAEEYENIGYKFLNGHFSLIDYSSKTLNIVGGLRLTHDVPKHYSNSVYVYGICVARGCFCADQDTVESFLQRKINKQTHAWGVVNCGVAEGIIGAALNDLQYVMHSSFRPNDIIVFLSEYDNYTINLLRNNGAEIYEASELFDGGLEEKRWFVDIMPHTTPRANLKIAEYIFEQIESDLNRRILLDSKLISVSELEMVNKEGPDGIADYIGNIRRQLIGKGVMLNNRVIGSIVMNCNPFTNGHLYLIEEAKKKCDELLVFVVSEDRSRFAFEDRFCMVKSAVSEIKSGEGIHVFESGKFMISQDTFPEYFLKDKLQDMEVDSSYDVSLFAGHIAPALGIKIRFVGEEPNDKVTEAYNRTMESILAKYGILLCEIPRIADNEGVISATRVRNCMDSYDLDGLRKLVPNSTFEIIKKKYM